MTHYLPRRDAVQGVISDVYFDKFPEPLPFPGTPSAWREFVDDAHHQGGTRGMAAMELTWTVDGLEVAVDLNRTQALAVVQRAADAAGERA